MLIPTVIILRMNKPAASVFILLGNPPQIPINMPPVTTLFQLSGAYVNLEYTLPNGEKIKLLDDTKIYLGCQVEKTNSDRCYGFVADNDYLLICEYGYNGTEPEIVIYKKR